MLTRILNYLQTKKELQFRFLKAAPFLKKGRYFSNETGTLWYPKRWKEKALPENKYLYQQIVYHNDRAIHAKTKIGKQLQTVRRKLINHFHCGQVTLKNPSLLYDGDVALLFRKPGAGKIINYSKKEILSFFREKKQMQEIFEKQSTWQSFGYPAPAILQTDEEHLFLIEEYIEKQDFSPEAGFEFIKNDILLHQKACGDDGLIVCLPEELAERFISMGYTFADTVEGKGQFSRRGGIVCSGARLPVGWSGAVCSGAAYATVWSSVGCVCAG